MVLLQTPIYPFVYTNVQGESRNSDQKCCIYRFFASPKKNGSFFIRLNRNAFDLLRLRVGSSLCAYMPFRLYIYRGTVDIYSSGAFVCVTVCKRLNKYHQHLDDEQTTTQALHRPNNKVSPIDRPLFGMDG